MNIHYDASQQIQLHPDRHYFQIDEIKYSLGWELPQNLRAIVWNGGTGYLDYLDRPLLFLENAAMFEEYVVPELDRAIDLWTQYHSELLTKEKKEQRNEELKKATVKYAGNLYDADEDSQNRMMRVVLSYQENELLDWVLSNNTLKRISVKDLKNILALATKQQNQEWIRPYTEEKED